MGHLREGRELDVTVESVTLALDAVDVPAVHARPDGMPRAGVVLHPDIGGLRPLFEDMARRLATHGLSVCVVEPFAGVPVEERGTTPEERFEAVKGLDDHQQLDMLSSAADLLVVEDGVSRVGVMGFCMGGLYTFKAAASDRFDAAVSFYGMLRTPDIFKGAGHTIEPLDVAAQMCSTLAIFGSVDPWTPASDIDALRAAWSGRADCEIVVVDDADHGFAHDPERPAHRSADAAACWDRTISWLLPTPA
jgi:carboxymethylenebutenolidase